MHSKNFVEMMNFASNSTVDYLESSTYILIACGFSKGQRSQDSEFREIISDVNIFTVSLDVSFYHGAAGAALFFHIS